MDCHLGWNSSKHRVFFPHKTFKKYFLQRKTLTRYHEGIQDLHSKLPSKAHKRDIRHPDEAVMSYPAPEEYSQEGIDELSSTCLHERAGVTHLVHCWFAQAHLIGPFSNFDFLYLSKELLRTTQ